MRILHNGVVFVLRIGKRELFVWITVLLLCVNKIITYYHGEHRESSTDEKKADPFSSADNLKNGSSQFHRGSRGQMIHGQQELNAAAQELVLPGWPEPRHPTPPHNPGPPRELELQPSWGCPTVPVISVETIGRMGNQISIYSTLWGVARWLDSVEVYLPSSLLNYLGKWFPNLSLPPLESLQHCNIKFVNATMTDLERFIRSKKKLKHNLLMRNYPLPMDADYFVRYETELLLELRMRDKYLKAAKKRMMGMAKLSNKAESNSYNITYIGVHVRRTDMVDYRKDKYGDNLVGTGYFNFAMDYFRKEFPNSIFFIVSDDPAWCESNLLVEEDDVFNAASYAAADLAILASCDHVIMSYGTFGFWGGFLSGGQVLLVKSFGSPLTAARIMDRFHPVQVREDYSLVFSRRKDSSGFDIIYGEKNHGKYPVN